jgi:hypothetical protein
METPAAGARGWLAASAAIAALWLFAASRWIATDTVVPWDSKNQFYAFFRFLAASVHAGVSPFWNPYHYGGHPSVADPQSLIFAPAFVLWGLFDGAPSLRTFDLIVYAHLLIGGLAVGMIGSRARWPIAACVLAAAVFMFGGAAGGRLQHTGNILCYGLFPPALLVLQLALERRSVLLGAAFAVVAAALALQRNQVALLLSLVLVGFVLAQIISAARPLHYLGERAAVLATAALVGFALVAVPFLLTMQFAVLSNRPAELLDVALKGSLYPANLAQLMVADIFGSHHAYWGPGPDFPEVALTDDSFNYSFVGSVPMVLFLWFGVVGGGAFRRGRWFLTGTLMAALLFALGRYTPLFGWAFEWVPGVRMFRRPVDGNFVLVIMLSLLAGHLLADYVREGPPRTRPIVSAIMGATVLLVIASAVMFSQRSGHAGAALIAVLTTAPITLGVFALLTLARTPRARAVAAVLVTIIAAAELLWWNVAFRLNAEPRSYYQVLEQPDAADAQVIAVLERAISERRASGEHPRVEVLGMGGPWQNLAVARGWEAINGYNPLRIGLYDRLVAPGEGNWLSELRDFPPSFDGYDCALAQALGLEFLVLDRPVEKVPHLVRRPVADVVQAGPRAWIYHLHDAAPRLEFNAGTARMVTWRPDRVEIETDSESGGMLVLHDLDYPGWVVDIDGREAPILRADVLFRGVEMPPGHHHVTFRFAPFAFENLTNALKLVMHKSGR